MNRMNEPTRVTQEQIDGIARRNASARETPSWRLGYQHGFASGLCPAQCSYHRHLSTPSHIREVQAGYAVGIDDRVRAGYEIRE